MNPNRNPNGSGTGHQLQMEMSSLSTFHQLPPLRVDALRGDDRKSDDVVIELHDDALPLHQSNTAQITESVVIITPKAQLALPPSIEKQELTLNVIGVTENGQIAVSRQNTKEMISHNVNAEVDEHSKERSRSAQSVCSAIDILDEAT